MLSRKNFSEKLRKMKRKRRSFSIRKLSIGVASVVVGISLYLNGNSIVDAATVNSDTTVQQSNVNVPDDQTEQVKSTKDSNFIQQEQSSNGNDQIVDTKDKNIDTEKTNLDSDNVEGVSISNPNIKIDKSYKATAEKHYEEKNNIYAVGASNRTDNAIEVGKKAVTYDDALTLTYHTEINTNSKEVQKWYEQSEIPTIDIKLVGDYPTIVSPMSSPTIVSTLNGQSYAIGEITHSNDTYTMKFSKDNLKPFFEKATIISFDADLKFKVNELNEIDTNKVYYDADSASDLSKENIDIKTLNNKLTAITVDDGIKQEEIPLKEKVELNHQVQVKAGTYKYGINKLNIIDNDDEAHNYTLIAKVSADGTHLSLEQPIKQLEFGDISSLFGSNHTFVIRQSKTSKVTNLENKVSLDNLKNDFISILQTLSLKQSSPKLEVSFSKDEKLVDNIYGTRLDVKQDAVTAVSAAQAKKLVKNIQQTISEDKDYTYYRFTYDGPTLYPTEKSSYNLTPILINSNVISLSDIQSYLLQNPLTSTSLKQYVNSVLGIDYSSDGQQYDTVADARVVYDQPEIIYSDAKGTPATGYIQLINQADHSKIYTSIKLTGLVGDYVEIPEVKKKDILNFISTNNLEFENNFVLPSKIFMSGKISNIKIYVHHKMKDISNDPKYKDLTQKVVKRSVRYIDPLTNQIVPLDQQTAVLHRTAIQDLVTGDISYGNWISEVSEFKAVNIPTFSGYEAINAEKADKSTIDANTKESSIVTITYKPVKQVVKLNYIDKKTGKILSVDELVGKTNEISDFSTSAKVSELEEKGYIVVSDETNGNKIIFDDNDKVEQEYNIYFNHKLTAVKDNKFIKRTVEYLEANTSKKIFPDNIQVVKFTRDGELDEVTHTISWSNWVSDEKEFKAIEVPKIKGYKADKDKIPNQNININTSNQKIVVTFIKNDPIGIRPDGNHPDTKMVTRTITFSGIERKPIIQSTEFTRLDSNGFIGYQDPITNKITYNNWKSITNKWDSYIPDSFQEDGVTYIPQMKIIPSKIITEDSENEVVEVKYNAKSNGTALIIPSNPEGRVISNTVKYIDYETGKTLEEDVAKNIAQTKFIYNSKLNDYIAKGWILVSSDLPTITPEESQEYVIVLIKPKNNEFVDEPTIAHNTSEVPPSEVFTTPEFKGGVSGIPEIHPVSPVAIIINYIDYETGEKLASDIVKGDEGKEITYNNRIEQFQKQGYSIIKNDIPKVFDSNASDYEVLLVNLNKESHQVAENNFQSREKITAQYLESTEEQRNNQDKTSTPITRIDNKPTYDNSELPQPKKQVQDFTPNSVVSTKINSKNSDAISHEKIERASKISSTTLNNKVEKSLNSSEQKIVDNTSVKTQIITTFEGKIPQPTDGIVNKLPLNIKLEWDKKIPKTTKIGIEEAIVKITYPDKTSKIIPVRINVVKPKAKTVHTLPGVLPDPKDCIQNVEKFPKGTKYSWKKKPNVSKPGVHKAVVIITLPNKLKTQVKVSITVEKALYYSSHLAIQKGKKLIYKGKIIKASSLIEDKDKMPVNTKYSWLKKPDLKSSGIKEGIIKIVFPNKHTKEIKIKVRVLKMKNSDIKATTVKTNNFKVSETGSSQSTDNHGESIRIIHSKAKTFGDIAAKEYVAKKMREPQIKFPSAGTSN